MEYSLIYKLREVARFVHLPYEAFIDLDPDQQAGHMAHYDVHHHLEAVLAHDRNKRQERRDRRRNRLGR